MVERTKRRFDLKPKRLVADTAYGTGKFLAFVVGAGITPHIPVWDKSTREDNTFSRADFVFKKRRDVYICPAGKTLITTGHVSTDHAIRYIASVLDCRACPLKPTCCPNMPSRRVLRDVNEDARDIARRKMKTKAFLKSRDERKRVEMRFISRRITASSACGSEVCPVPATSSTSPQSCKISRRWRSDYSARQSK